MTVRCEIGDCSWNDEGWCTAPVITVRENGMCGEAYLAQRRGRWPQISAEHRVFRNEVEINLGETVDK